MRRRTAAEHLVAAIWSYGHHQSSGGAYRILLKRFAWLRYRFWSIVTGSDIQLGVTLGRGIRLPHPNGVVMHRCALVGEDCLIMQQTTLGQLEADLEAPRLGNGVYVGAGAKVLGGVTIGDHARIGANSVVLSDVPAHATAVGIPARIVARRDPEVATSADASARESRADAHGLAPNGGQ